MNILLWDTRQLDVSKDFAGGFGVGMYRGLGGPRDAIVRWFYRRDRRPAALLFAHLAAVFARLGHRVKYVVDQPPRGADLYVFNPSLITLDLERQVIARLLAEEPQARVLVVGTTASILPQEFEDLGVTVVQGEAEQLLWRLDEVLDHPGAKVQLGVIEDLDRLPLPDWSPLGPARFRIGYDFWRFPTGLIQASRGCRFKCNYCPYLVLDNATRFRDPEAVVEEIRHGIRRWGFQSFKFRDPLFGLSRERTFRIIEQIARLPRKIQFSIESRIELLPPETLRLMKRAGLTSVTFGIETPSDPTLQNYRRQTIDKDRQQAFIATCRELGHSHGGRVHDRLPRRYRAIDPPRPRLRDRPGPDVRQFQRGHALSGHGVLRADARSPGRDRLQPIQRLYADAEVRPPHARADRVAVGEMLSTVLFPLAISARKRRAALAGPAAFGASARSRQASRKRTRQASGAPKPRPGCKFSSRMGRTRRVLHRMHPIMDGTRQSLAHPTAISYRKAKNGNSCPDLPRARFLT